MNLPIQNVVHILKYKTLASQIGFLKKNNETTCTSCEWPAEVRGKYYFARISGHLYETDSNILEDLKNTQGVFYMSIFQL